MRSQVTLPDARLSRRMLLFGLAALLVAPCSRAWNARGHRISAELATQLLTPTARAQLLPLVGSDQLAQVSNYMDEERSALAIQYPGSPSWHYDDRPACHDTSSYSDYCPDGNCATAQVARWLAVLADPGAASEQRSFAVKLLVHVVSDLHQPLHAANNHDKGGNQVQVLLPGRARAQRLHEVWDVEFVDLATQGKSEPAYAAGLMMQFAPEFAGWQRGTVLDWAAETYQLAQLVAYRPIPGFACDWSPTEPIALPESYVQGAVAIIPRQLARAGARIASLLNSALAGASAAHATA